MLIGRLTSLHRDHHVAALISVDFFRSPWFLILSSDIFIWFRLATRKSLGIETFVISLFSLQILLFEIIHDFSNNLFYKLSLRLNPPLEFTFLRKIKINLYALFLSPNDQSISIKDIIKYSVSESEFNFNSINFYLSSHLSPILQTP